MKLDAEEWLRLRIEFIEAAAKYDEYETFMERNEQSEDWYSNNGRYLPVGLIRWPYSPYRKSWILAPDVGENEEAFSTMKTLFNKAWLWLPKVIADEVVKTAEMHLSPPADIGLYWAKADYQYWCWLLWFHWLREYRAESSTKNEKPSKKMALAPFRCSSDLINQWSLDGSEGTIPEWLDLATVVPDPPNTVREVELIGRTLKWGSKRFDMLEDTHIKALRPLIDGSRFLQVLGCQRMRCVIGVGVPAKVRWCRSVLHPT